MNVEILVTVPWKAINCRHAKLYRALLVLLGLVPVESLHVVVAGRLKGSLNDGVLASVEPDHGHMEGSVLVHEAERLEDVLDLALRVRFRIPFGVATPKLHVPVDHTYQRTSPLFMNGQETRDNRREGI